MLSIWWKTYAYAYAYDSIIVSMISIGITVRTTLSSIKVKNLNIASIYENINLFVYLFIYRNVKQIYFICTLFILYHLLN